MEREVNLNILVERIERLEVQNAQTDEIIRGDGKDPGLVQRVRTIEDLVVQTKYLVRWASVGALTGAGALIWSMARDFIAKGGTP